jgi:hypothetical protein
MHDVHTTCDRRRCERQSKQKSYVKRNPHYVEGIDINRASCFPSLDVDRWLGMLQRIPTDRRIPGSPHSSAPPRMLSIDALVSSSVSSLIRIRSSGESSSASYRA